MAAGKLVGPTLYRLLLATQIDDLSQEQTRQFAIRGVVADLVGFPTGEAGQPDRVVQAETLVNFGVGVQLCAFP